MSRSCVPVARLAPWFMNASFLVGMLLTSLQFVKIGPMQPGQLWALPLAAVLVVRGAVPVLGREVLVHAAFLSVALLMTRFGGYPHVKAVDQTIKFAVVYPVFYLIGRAYGWHYLSHRLPFGYVLLFAFLAVQIAAQQYHVPVIYQDVDFQLDALHGTFLERNWLAFFFFGISGALYLQSARNSLHGLAFLAFNMLVAVQSGSKSILIPCAMLVFAQMKGRLGLKLIMAVAAVAFYYFVFGHDLSGSRLDERINDERGLALTVSLELAAQDWVGHGFGFVEAWFGGNGLQVLGLTKGVNSVFCVPLDLFLIAGVPGLAVWLMFFTGIGLGRTTAIALLPLAAWSLTNPLHQSEIAWLWLGYFVSRSRGASSASTVSLPVAKGGGSTSAPALIRHARGDGRGRTLPERTIPRRTV